MSLDLDEAVWDGVDDQSSSEQCVERTPGEVMNVTVHEGLRPQLSDEPVERCEPLVGGIVAISNA